MSYPPLSLRGHYLSRSSLGVPFAFPEFMNRRRFYIYIMTNHWNKVLYTGVTNNLLRRVYEHREQLADGFTCKYKVNKLVYYEEHSDPLFAIEREKQVKAGSRRKKIELIDRLNPRWEDLYEKLL